jgi:hypothetical protein
VEVPDDQDLASQVVPESCAAHREVWGEALTGVRVGQPLSHEMSISKLGADAVTVAEGDMPGRVMRVFRWPSGVREPGMHVRALHGNREICEPTEHRGDPVKVRIGKARSRRR